AFATSPQPGVSDPITFTSGMFWRPEASEITNPDEQGLWGFLPSGSIIWITQITNLGAPQSISLELGAPPVGSGRSAAKGFRVLDASGLPVSPEVSVLSSTGTRAADGRVIVTLPSVPTTTPATVTVLIDRPESVTRGSSPSWDVTVTPPGAESTISVPITSYADFLASVS